MKAMVSEWKRDEVRQMKNYLLAMLVVMISVVMLAPVQVRADETATIGNYTYTLSGKVATITSYNGTESTVELPTEVTYGGKTYSVTAVGASAFAGNKYLETLVIPKGITSLGRSAFKDCVNLSSVTINDDINNCDSGAINTYYTANYSVFYNAGSDANSLEVTFGDDVTSISGYLFATAVSSTSDSYAHVTSVTFSDSVKTIGAYAFYHCYDLEEIGWGSKVQVIGDGAFSGTDTYVNFTVPSTVTSIGVLAFEDWGSLESLTIPKSVTSIGRGAFRNAVELSSVTINGNIDTCDSGAINTYYTANYSVFYNAGSDADSLEVTFGDDVTSVGGYLFATAESSTSDSYAHVTSVTFSDSVKTIGAYAFYHCYDIEEISWGSKVQVIGDGAFSGTDTYVNFTVPSTVTSIGALAFEDWESLEILTIPKSVTTIGRGAFRNAVELSSVTINGNIGTCDSGAINTYYTASYSVFYNAGSDADSLEVTFGDDVTSVGGYLFATAESSTSDSYAHVTSVTFSDSVKTIGAYAFYHCYDIEEISWGSKVQVIGDGAFSGTDTYVNFTVPSTVTSIGALAFEDWESLESLTIPKSVTTIGRGAFRNAVELSSVTINGNIGTCDSGAINTYYTASYSVFYKAGANADSLEVNFGSDVKSVPAYLFATAVSYADDTYAHITAVKLSDSVTTIGKYAFYNCYDLESVTLSSSLTTIGDYAFANAGFSTIQFNSNVTSIADNSFYGVTATALYPYPNLTWTSSMMKDYGGTLTWTAYDTVVPISDTTISLSSTSYTYNGSAKKPTVTITYGDMTLVNGTDYSVSYSNNTNAGTATVTITGKGYFSGTKKVNFTISKAAQTVSVKSKGSTSINVNGTTTWTAKTSGNGTITYSTTASSSVATVDSKTGKVTANGVGTVYLYATAASTTNYKASSKTLIATIKIGLKATTISSVKQSGSTVTVKWSKISGAKGYYVYRSTSKSSGYSLVDTVKSGSTVSYKDTASKTNGKTYYYKVVAYSGSTKSADSSVKSLKYMKTAAPTLENTSKGITVSWSKISGATGYYVYRKAGSGSYKLLTTVESASKVSYTDTSASNGTTYTYYVQPYNSSSKGAYTTKKTVRLTAVKLSSVKNSASKKMTVKWSKNTKSSGYQIEYSTSSSFSSSKMVTVSGASSASNVISSLTKGKTYYVRIRTYKTVSGTKYYSAWSAKKSVKISK